MVDGAFDYHQMTDLFAGATANRFTGSMTFHFDQGEPKNVEVHWRLSFGESVARFIRILRGRPPPGSE